MKISSNTVTLHKMCAVFAVSLWQHRKCYVLYHERILTQSVDTGLCQSTVMIMCQCKCTMLIQGQVNSFMLNDTITRLILHGMALIALGFISKVSNTIDFSVCVIRDHVFPTYVSGWVSTSVGEVRNGIYNVVLFSWINQYQSSQQVRHLASNHEIFWSHDDT